MKKYIQFVCVSIIATIMYGCATSYKLSDKGVELNRNMTQKQAEEIIRGFVHPLNDNGRIFSSETELPVCGNAKVVLNGSAMAYNANYRENTGFDVMVLPGTVTVTEKYAIKAGRFKIDFKDVTKIRVWKTDSSLKVPCPNIRPGYNVFLKTTVTSGPQIVFNVSSEDLDRLLATLLFYSPNVKVNEGAGF